jgi:hypothetical protein
MSDFSMDNKVSILLKLLEVQTEELRRKDEVEQLLFQWTTGLLLAVFGGVLALSGKAVALPSLSAMSVRILASIIVVIPALISLVWIFRRSRISTENTKAIENIQELLHLFEDGYYGPHSPYPHHWQGQFTKGRLKRKTPKYYASVILLMSACVVAAIWLVL